MHFRISDLSKEGMLQAIKDKDLRFLQVSHPLPSKSSIAIQVIQVGWRQFLQVLVRIHNFKPQKQCVWNKFGFKLHILCEVTL